MVYPSCSRMPTYRNVTSTITHVMEFAEMCLTVFWTYVHALLISYLAPGPRSQDHVDLIYKRIHFQSDIQARELAKCTIICM